MAKLLTLKLKEGFFDRKAVMDALGPVKHKIFMAYGLGVKRQAQKSLVYADGPSAAGSPPHAHKSRNRTRVSKKTGKSRTRAVSFLREFLYSAWDKETQSVVAGPSRFDTTVDPAALPALEYGGSSTIVDRGKRRTAKIAARPFMGPASEAEKPAMLASWKDSVR